ncbi:MAG: hypothetical protein ABI328_11210 [Gemmatimonadaceae bacterium]
MLGNTLPVNGRLKYMLAVVLSNSQNDRTTWPGEGAHVRPVWCQQIDDIGRQTPQNADREIQTVGRINGYSISVQATFRCGGFTM